MDGEIRNALHSSYDSHHYLLHPPSLTSHLYRIYLTTLNAATTEDPVNVFVWQP